MSESLEFVEVGGKNYRVIKKGREQAQQVVMVSRWLGTYGPGLVAGLQGNDGSFEVESGFSFIGQILENLTSDALVDLFSVLLGCSKKVAEEHFDIGILVDVLVEVYDGQPGIRRVIDRFFSTPESEEPTEDSSTKSEQPTDIQMEKS